MNFQHCDSSDDSEVEKIYSDCGVPGAERSGQ